jgi:hypothetical protein
MLLFLGSGVSVPSSLPSVQRITDLVLGQESGLLSPLPPVLDPLTLDSYLAPETADDVYFFLRVLRDIDVESRREMACYWAGKQYKKSGAIYRDSTTYEDLFSMCEQIRWNGEGLNDEASVCALVELAQLRAHSVLGVGSRSSRLVRLYSLARQATRLIELIVEKSLHCTRPIGLNVVPLLASMGKLDIVTLNHDTLIEQVLTSARVPFADGFGSTDGEVRWRDDLTFNEPDCGVRLIKPHGSINWRTFLVGSSVKLGLVEDLEKSTWTDKTGKELKRYVQQPTFLTGAGKLVSYNSGIFAEMTFQFHDALRSNDVLVMSGYGWGDVGINLRLESWLDHKPQRKLLLLHTSPEDLCNRAVQLDRNYRQWEESGKLVEIKSWLCDTSIDVLVSNLPSG